MNEKVKQALRCLWIGNASLRVVRSEKRADERGGGSLRDGYEELSAPMQSLDPSGLNPVFVVLRS